MKKSKLQKIIIISFFILSMILCLIVKIFISKKEENNLDEQRSIHDTTAISMGYKNSIYDVYNGNLKALDISQKLTTLLEGYLPINAQEFVNLTDTELPEYFQENKKYISKYLGLTEEQSFKEFTKKLTESEIDFSTSPNIEYIENSFTNENEMDSIEIKLTYSNNKSLDCKIYTSKNYESNQEFKFIVKIL